MSPDHISQLILDYRYWILIPLTFVEGPLVAFVAGTLAAVGYFNIYVLAVLFFVRDVGLDLVYYYVGHKGGKSKLVQKMLKKLRITENHLEGVRHMWDKHPGKTMFIGKLSYGIANAFIMLAGMIRMPLGKFIKYGSLVAIAQYGTLLVLGFYLGNTFGGTVARVVANIQYVAVGAAILISGYYIFTWFMRGKFFKEEKEAEMEIKGEDK